MGVDKPKQGVDLGKVGDSRLILLSCVLFGIDVDVQLLASSLISDADDMHKPIGAGDPVLTQTPLVYTLAEGISEAVEVQQSQNAVLCKCNCPISEPDKHQIPVIEQFAAVREQNETDIKSEDVRKQCVVGV